MKGTPKVKTAADHQAEDAAEFARVSKMTDAEVLLATGNGRFGAAIVGTHLAERSHRLVTVSGNGRFGPAIVDPDYAKKEAAKRAALKAEGSSGSSLDNDEADTADRNIAEDNDIDPTDLNDPRNPWTYVTLSGAKVLAMKHQVSHTARVKKAELIGQLQAAKVIPPPVPTDRDEGNDPDALVGSVRPKAAPVGARATLDETDDHDDDPDSD